MANADMNNTTNKTTEYLSKMGRMWSLFGIQNLWMENAYDTKFFKHMHRFGTFCMFILVPLEISAIFTQTKLSEKQSTDLIIFVTSHVILISSSLAPEYYKEEIRHLLITLCITLKKVYNDQEIEQRMIKRAAFFSFGFLTAVSISLICYGVDAFMEVALSGGTFTTVVIGWPDIEDTSIQSNLIRFIFYIIWWIFIARMTIAYTLAIFTTVAISHQFKNVQSYFYKLNDIFDNENEETQRQKEIKYEQSLKVGIDLHSQTIRCTEQCQHTCSNIISAEMLLNICVFAFLMLQMMKSERTPLNVLANVTTAACILSTTGFLMWNAGDITVEAAFVPTAMFSSGWQHCRGDASKRVRTLLTLAMSQAQNHVAMRSFYIVDISYESYLMIVKSSYSAFSLLY